jgi:hypothetical protein
MLTALLPIVCYSFACLIDTATVPNSVLYLCYRRQEGWTSLHWAASKNKHDAVRKLLALRGDLSLLNQVGLWPAAPARTAVFVAALRVCVLASSHLPVKFDLRIDVLAHFVCVLHRMALVR